MTINHKAILFLSQVSGCFNCYNMRTFINYVVSIILVHSQVDDWQRKRRGNCQCVQYGVQGSTKRSHLLLWVVTLEVIFSISSNNCCLITLNTKRGYSQFYTSFLIGSSKAALDMLTKMMGLELGPHNVSECNKIDSCSLQTLIVSFVTRYVSMLSIQL